APIPPSTLPSPPNCEQAVARMSIVATAATWRVVPGSVFMGSSCTRQAQGGCRRPAGMPRSGRWPWMAGGFHPGDEIGQPLSDLLRREVAVIKTRGRTLHEEITRIVRRDLSLIDRLGDDRHPRIIPRV